MTHTADQLIAAYVKLRDEKASIAERHKAELDPYIGALERLETQLMDMLNAQGSNSIKTKSGTAYRSTATTAKVDDWPGFITFVLDQGDTELLVRNVNKTRMTELLEAGVVVPGCSQSQVSRINVRRS